MFIEDLRIPSECEKCPNIAPNIEAIGNLERGDPSFEEQRRNIINELSALVIEDCNGAYLDENRFPQESVFYCGRFSSPAKIIPG